MSQHSEQRAPSTAHIRSFVGRHPVSSFLVLAYVGLWTCWMPILFLGAPPRPFSALAVIVGLAVPAFLVTAVTSGRDGVRQLVHRSVRWRVGLRWYLVAVLAIPLGTLAVAMLLGTPSVDGSLAVWFGLELLLALVTVQLFEEVGWVGFAQYTLQGRYGPMRTSLLLGTAFGLIHLPTYFRAPITGRQVVGVLVTMVMVIPLSILLRILIAWLSNRTALSVLLAALLHASFNTASGSEFLGRLGAGPVASLLPLAVVAVLGLVVAVATKGRLGYDPGRTAEPEVAVPGRRPPLEHARIALASPREHVG